MAYKKIFVKYDDRLTPEQALQYASRACRGDMSGIVVWRNGVRVWFTPYRKNPNIDVYLEDENNERIVSGPGVG